MATMYSITDNRYDDGKVQTMDDIAATLEHSIANDETFASVYHAIRTDARGYEIVVELDRDDTQHYEVIAEEYKIQVTHLDAEEEDLHPLWCQYDGQLTTQPAFIEYDTTTPYDELSADYSREIGGGVPEDVYYGKRRRYSISPHLTLEEINKLLDEVAAVLEKDPDTDVERMCADRLTDSHGVMAVEDWMEGIDPCEEYGITVDSTDTDLETIGAAMIDYATGEGCTITGVSDYCENLRDELLALLYHRGVMAVEELRRSKEG
jgi:hypothetical protein